MGILHKLKFALLRARHQDPITHDTLAAIKQDGRLHVRIKVPDLLGGFAKITGDERSGQLLNLSYGGMAVAFAPDEDDRLPATLELAGTVGILDQTQAFRFKLIRTTPLDGATNLLGFSFIHDEAHTLLFLRRFIDPILEGGSMMPIPAELRKDRYKAAEWLCFRGDRSTDLVIRTSPDNNQIEDLLLIFAAQDGYRQLLYRNGTFSTGMIDEANGSMDLGTAAVRSTHKPDEAVIRTAICLLASVTSPVASLLSPLVSQLVSMVIKRP